MAQKEQNKLSWGLALALIGFSAAFFPLYPSWAKSCTQTEIRSKIEQFKDPKNAQTALYAVVHCGEEAIASLEDALSESAESSRVHALQALGKMGGVAQNAVPAIVTILKDRNKTLRSEAATALIQIGQSVKATGDGLSPWNLEIVQDLAALQKNLSDALTQLEKDRQDWPQKPEQIQSLRLLQTALQTQLERQQNHLFYQLMTGLKSHPWIVAIAIGTSLYLIGLPLVWFILLRVRPLKLLTMSQALKPFNEFALPAWLGGIKLPLRSLLLVHLFHHRSRVLDAWVAKHWGQAQAYFLEQPTVSDRKIHIPIQIKLKEQLIDKLVPKDFHPIFSQSPVCIMIVGEGGVGKTSLAYRIARWGMKLEEASVHEQNLCAHRMFPVTIERELEQTSLLAAIREQLPQQEGEYIADELLAALLKRQRILLILDHVSEMGEKTYAAMQEALAKTPVNALIITSRLPEKDLGRPQKTVLEPQKIEGKTRLSDFIQPYLEARGKRDIFEYDDEFYDACKLLSKMMADTLQSATALLVRMYVDQVIEVGGLKRSQLPDNIPDLMLKYLEWLNRPDAIDPGIRKDDATVLQDSQAVAEVCLRENFYPVESKYEEVISALAALSPAGVTQEDLLKRLTYLEKKLRLVKRSANRVRIILDPVAEYLAAMRLVDLCQQKEYPERWQQFFEKVDAKPDRSQIRGFLLAVRNCCEQEGKKIPEDVLAGLNQRANLNPEEIEQSRRRQRINRLIDDLYDSEPKYLGQAIRNLQEEGSYAHKAIPDLLKVLKSETLDVALRIEALNALMKIQPDPEQRDVLCRELLGNRSYPPTLRVAAIKALLQLSQDPTALAVLLDSYFQDETEPGVVRVQAGEGLRKLGVLQNLLVLELSQDATPTIHLRLQPTTWVVELPNEIQLVMVSIPSGSFMMGSPEYEHSSSVGEHPQHLVTVPDFWIGQFPVTQAQYEAVTGHNPSGFRAFGSDSPVETVSWYDAVAFCQRLSELTQQDFRLPSEAEWEYACRAGTTTPFNLGETITTDYANYRGTDWDYGGAIYSGAYAQEPKGIFREQTTQVGSFPANAFGLYDMHGNVWEWCADDWNDDYQGAPDDGSPWRSENDNDFRLVRGGSWNEIPHYCRSAFRVRYNPNDNGFGIGLRVVASSIG